MQAEDRDAFEREPFARLRRRGHKKTKAEQLSALILEDVALEA